MSKKTISENTLSSLGNVDYWKSLNPELTITERPYLGQRPELNTATLDANVYVAQMKQEGYVKLESVLPESDMERMALAIINLVNEGLPPAFAYIYDEFWQVFRNIAPLVIPIFGENYRLSTNRWAWHIPASESSAGFTPHRDMVGCPEPVMRPDGLPQIATVWIPLRDVSAANACMHVLPFNQDPNSPDNLTDTAIPQDRIQNIRALPCKAGSILSWNPNVLHWGSRGSKWVKEPRISIATYLIRADGPAFTSVGVEDTQPLTFDFRIGVISRILSHYDKDDISVARYPAELLKFCKRYEFVEPYEWRFKQPGQPATAASDAQSQTLTRKAGRNEPCPCGSGKKYKHCHGK